MGLRNAFEETMTEQTARALLRVVSFARDSADRLRVVIDGQPSVSVFNGNNGTSLVANAGQQPAPFASGSWNLMDARESARVASETQWVMTRNRWTIT